MFASYRSGEYQSVIFFADGKPDREMMFPEFEAVLDNFVPLPSYAGQVVPSVVLGINGQLQIISACFFLLAFDENGNADRKWNVPLQQLIDQAAIGPDLGGGSIRLCCRSLCPLAWHQKDLWDPDLQITPNHFELLKQRIKQNRLGFKQLAIDVDDLPQHTAIEIPTLAQPSEPTPPTQPLITGGNGDEDALLAQALIQYVRKKVIQDNQQQLEEQLATHALELSTLRNQCNSERQQLEQLHSNELRALDAELGKQHKRLQELENDKQQLQDSLIEQQAQVDLLKQQITQGILQEHSNEAEKLAKLEQHFQQELELQQRNFALSFQQQLQAKEVENIYLRERMVLQEQELTEVHRDQARNIEQAGEDFISLLKQNELNVVAYHAGVGTITIPLQDIGRYLENSTAYVAALCEVSEASYRAWLAHYQSPECGEHSHAKGERCGKKLRRVELPNQFVAGRSDRCPLHWHFQQE